MNLDVSTYGEITSLCEQGNRLEEAGDFQGALRLFHLSWTLLPEPKEDWEAATWILSAIGDAHFSLGNFQNAISALSSAVRCPDGLGNPFIHLRLGEAAFELRQMDRAGNELARAYMGAGRDIFANEDPKYLAYLESILRPMPGRETL